MRISMLALALSLALRRPCAAQVVIDVEGQKAASPPAPERGKSQPPGELPDQSTKTTVRSAKPIHL